MNYNGINFSSIKNLFLKIEINLFKSLNISFGNIFHKRIIKH